MPDVKADAVLVPASMAGGGDWRAKSQRVGAVAKPLLGLGEKDKVRTYLIQVDGCYLAVREADHEVNTLQFPTRHDRSGEIRHEWVDRDDGVRVGTLKPETA